MLDKLRSSSRSALSYVLVGSLIVVFAVFFGAPADGCRASGGRVTMASVAGTEVVTDDVNIVYNRIWGSQRNANEDEFVNNQALALRSVLLIHLVADKAEKAGLRVSEEEFKQYLLDPTRNIEYRYIYGRQGSFDGPLYKAYIQNQLRVAITRYEDFKRKELLARKYLAMIDMNVGVSNAELEERLKLRNTEVNLEFIQVTDESLADALKLDPAQVDAFLADNLADVQKRYDANKAEYEKPEEVLIRRIFIARPEETDTEANRSAAQKRFEEARRRVLDNKEDFATVAAEVTEDFDKEKKGLMDWTSLQNIDQNIAQAIRDEQPGAVKEVNSPYAYMLVRLEERKEATTTPFDDVKRELAEKLIKESRASGIVDAMTQAIGNAAQAAPSLQAALDAVKADPARDAALPWETLAVKETGFFGLEGQDMSAMFGAQLRGLRIGRGAWDRIPEIGKSPELVVHAMTLTSDKPMGKQVYRVGEASVLVRLKERKEAPPLAELAADKRVELVEDLRNERASMAIGSWQALFLMPSDDYGPWIEAMYKKALDKGEIKLFESASPAVPKVARKKEDAAKTAPGDQGAESKGSEDKGATKPTPGKAG